MQPGAWGYSIYGAVHLVVPEAEESPSFGWFDGGVVLG